MKEIINIILLVIVGLIIASMITVYFMDVNKAPMFILILVIGLAVSLLVKNRINKSE